MSKRNSGLICIVDYCHNHQGPHNSDTGIRFHNLPSDTEIAARWLEFAKAPPSTAKRRVICSTHFSPDSYKNTLAPDTSHLSPLAVPSIYHHPQQTHPSKGSSGYYCSAINCQNRQNGLAVDQNGAKTRFHSFPKDVALCKRWIINCRNQALDKIPIGVFQSTRHVVCSVHFDDIMYQVPHHRHLSSTKLMSTAIPTRIAAPNPPPVVNSRRLVVRHIAEGSTPDMMTTNEDIIVDPAENQPSSSSDIATQTVNVGPSHSTSLKQQVNSLRCKLRYARLPKKAPKKLSTPLFPILPHPLQLLLESQFKNCKRKLRGSRWSRSEIDLALGIYYHSPRCYKHLRRNVNMYLPSVAVLKRHISNCLHAPGICPKLMAIAKKKFAGANPHERRCLLTLDSMSLKQTLSYSLANDRVVGFVSQIVCDDNKPQIADNILVLMLRGIFSNWKHVIGHYLIRHSVGHECVQRIIFEALSSCTSANMNVMAVVCDQESTQWQAVKSMCQPGHTFFNNPETGSAVYFVVDPPHLLKNTRNALRKYDITHMGGVAKWQHLLSVFNNEKQRTLKLIPKVKNVHFELPFRAKMKVSYAAQVLSRSMGVAIRVLSTFGEIHHDSLETADFVESANRLFDLMNTVSKNCCVKACLNRETVESFMLELDYFILWLQQLHFRDAISNQSRYSLPFRDGWILTLTSMKCIISDIFASLPSINFICTRRFNQDCLENTFSILRGKCGFNHFPTYTHALFALRLTASNNTLKPISSATNCDVDDDVALGEGIDIDDNTEVTPDANMDVNAVEASGQDMISSSSDIGATEAEVVQYISGSIVHSVKDKLCNTCYEIITTPHRTSLMISLKTISNCHLESPSSGLSSLFIAWETCFRNNIANNISRNNIKKYFSHICSLSPLHVRFKSLFHCNCLDILLDKYISLRLFHHCKST